MRIKEFWAKNFRSLRDVHLKDLGKFNILYGANGSGKSNVLGGMDLLFRLAHARHKSRGNPWDGISATRERQDGLQVALDPWDRFLGASGAKTVLGAKVEIGGGAGIDVVDLEVELDFDAPANPPWVRIRRVGSYELPREDPPDEGSGAVATSTDEAWGRARRQHYGDEANRLLGLAGASVHLIGAPRSEAPADDLMRASASDDLSQVESFRLVERFVGGPPLHRTGFRVAVAPGIGPLRGVIKEQAKAFPRQELPIDAQGLGSTQVYAILAQALLHPGQPIAIEEPEAHLHAPTTGRALRHLLKRSVDEGHVEQLFISTHSNLFDLDETGYWDVKLEAGATTVTRAPVEQMDAHFWEPGPARHALLALMKTHGTEEIVATGPGGRPITAKAMLDDLLTDGEIAKSLLEDVHAAVIRTIRARAKRGAPS